MVKEPILQHICMMYIHGKSYRKIIIYLLNKQGKKLVNNNLLKSVYVTKSNPASQSTINQSTHLTNQTLKFLILENNQPASQQ